MTASAPPVCNQPKAKPSRRPVAPEYPISKHQIPIEASESRTRFSFKLIIWICLGFYWDLVIGIWNFHTDGDARRNL